MDDLLIVVKGKLGKWQSVPLETGDGDGAVIGSTKGQKTGLSNLVTGLITPSLLH